MHIHILDGYWQKLKCDPKVTMVRVAMTAKNKAKNRAEKTNSGGNLPSSELLESFWDALWLE